jgi:glycogenin glucosyltransferase
MLTRYVTLCTIEEYLPGALVMCHSLRQSGTIRDIVCLTASTMPQAARMQLTAAFDHVIDVDVIDTQDSEALQLLGRPELGVTATKIKCWTLTQYHKCVYLDADTLVLANVDDLFDRPELSAAPDIGWPDCFNSGVFVFVPSAET